MYNLKYKLLYHSSIQFSLLIITFFKPKKKISKKKKLFDLSYLVGSFVLGLLGCATYVLIISPYYISPLRKIPGPPSESLLFGNFLSLITQGVKYLFKNMSTMSLCIIKD